MIEFITITGSYFDAKRGKMSSTRDKRHENLVTIQPFLFCVTMRWILARRARACDGDDDFTRGYALRAHPGL